MTNKVFDAAAARLLVSDAHSIHGEYMRKQTEAILDKIKEVASTGLTNISVSTTDGIVQQRLRSLGFVTKVNYDQRDGDFMLVSW